MVSEHAEIVTNNAHATERREEGIIDYAGVPMYVDVIALTFHKYTTAYTKAFIHLFWQRT